MYCAYKKKNPPTSFAGTIAKTALDNGGNGGVGVSCADVSQKIKNANICLMNTRRSRNNVAMIFKYLYRISHLHACLSLF